MKFSVDCRTVLIFGSFYPTTAAIAIACDRFYHTQLQLILILSHAIAIAAAVG